MLTFDKYYNRFLEIQDDLYRTFEKISINLKPGNSEKNICNSIESELQLLGYNGFWYPTLVYIGRSTGSPISRRFHLPSVERILKENDIICIDVTPIDKTVWGNWCQTVSIGKDSFYDTLCEDSKEITDNLCQYAKNSCETIGDLYIYFLKLSAKKEMFLLAPYNSIGHSIFQVPKGSTVEKFNMRERIQINEEFFDFSLDEIDLLSIEPQLAKSNPVDGKIYSAKQQGIIKLCKNHIYEMD